MMRPPRNLRRVGVWALGLAAVVARGAPCQELSHRPKYAPTAVRLFLDRGYFRAHDAPDFWALAPYYVSQPDDGACSAASVAMAINALRAKHNLTADEPLATPQSVIDAVAAPLWREKLAGPGVTLDELAVLVERVAAKWGMRLAPVEVVRFDQPSEEAKNRLRGLLLENERSSRDVVVANFLQSVATGDPEGAVGHFAPVGAYDAQTRRVLLFDPDRQWYEPYWISEETLLEAVTTIDAQTGRSRGLLRIAVEAASSK